MDKFYGLDELRWDRQNPSEISPGLPRRLYRYLVLPLQFFILRRMIKRLAC
jgi:hypothetical protein